MSAVLHYIYDPLCGWCYGVTPLIQVCRALLPVRAHGGGMMAGAARRVVTPALRDYVRPHDARIAQLSGQRFGAAYSDGLLRDSGTVFDSEPPTAAVLAAEQLAGRGLDLLECLQRAHYVEGRSIAERAVLLDVAQALGLARADFNEALVRQQGPAVQAHMAATRQFMARVGARGFPTLVLETRAGLQVLGTDGYLNRVQAFQDRLRALMDADMAPQVI